MGEKLYFRPTQAVHNITINLNIKNDEKFTDFSSLFDTYVILISLEEMLSSVHKKSPKHVMDLQGICFIKN